MHLCICCACMHICVCMHACMYVYAYMGVHACACARMRICTFGPPRPPPQVLKLAALGLAPNIEKLPTPMY